MGLLKNLSIVYEEKGYFIKDFSEWDHNDFFKFNIMLLLDHSDALIDLDIYDLFHALFDDDADKEEYYLMVSDKENFCNVHCDSLDDMIIKASILAKENLNVFFAPNAFWGWRIDQNVVSAKSIFVDIDDVPNVDFSDMESDELTEWLMDTYDLTEELLPNWVVCSGHGLHLYYLVEKLNLRVKENKELRRTYTDYLITYFSADKSCRNSSRILRVPNTRNLKHSERKTILHQLNESNDHSLERLEFFYRPRVEIEEYFKKNQEEKNAKAKATREKNQQLNEKKSTDIISVPMQKKTIITKQLKQKYADFTKEDLDRINHMTYYNNFSPSARYWNIIKDLHNYYVRHHGNICGYRNMFFLIMATMLRNVRMNYSNAIDFLEKYMTEDCRITACNTIEGVYARNKNYQFKNTTIAELLNFTERDIAHSYCHFSEERQQKALKETQRKNWKKQAAVRKAERGVAEKRQKQYLFVKENYDSMTLKEMAEYLSVSESTISRIRKQIRDENS